MSIDEGIQIGSIIGRTTGSLSIVGSSLIIYMILSDRRRKLSRPYHRLMLMMSVFDIIQSVAMVCSVSALPRQSGIHGAKGNELTCTAQGFFMVLGLAVPLYNSCLNIYYVLTIRYNTSPEAFSKYEYILHAISILLPLSMAVSSAILGIIVPRQSVCTPRGKIIMVVASLTLSICFLVCMSSMICICWTVLSRTAKTRKYTKFNTRQSSANLKSRTDYKDKTIKQACLYALAFLLTYTPLIVNLLYTRGGYDNPPYIVVFLTDIFYPLQGFWNFVFYIRPGVKREIKSNPEKSYLGAIRDVILRSNVQSSGTIRLPAHQAAQPSPSNGIVEIATYPPVPGVSLDDCTKSSNEPIKFSTGKYDPIVIDNSVLSATSHDTSDSGYLGNISNKGTKSSEDTAMEDDIEHQSELQFKTGKRRRLSLVDISSILDGQDYSDINSIDNDLIL